MLLISPKPSHRAVFGCFTLKTVDGKAWNIKLYSFMG